MPKRAAAIESLPMAFTLVKPWQTMASAGYPAVQPASSLLSVKLPSALR